MFSRVPTLARGIGRHSVGKLSTGSTARNYSMFHLCKNPRTAERFIQGGAVVGGLMGAVGGATGFNTTIHDAMAGSLACSVIGAYFGGAAVTLLPCAIAVTTVCGITLAVTHKDRT